MEAAAEEWRAPYRRPPRPPVFAERPVVRARWNWLAFWKDGRDSSRIPRLTEVSRETLACRVRRHPHAPGCRTAAPPPGIAQDRDNQTISGCRRPLFEEPRRDTGSTEPVCWKPAPGVRSFHCWTRLHPPGGHVTAPYCSRSPVVQQSAPHPGGTRRRDLRGVR